MPFGQFGEQRVKLQRVQLQPVLDLQRAVNEDADHDACLAISIHHNHRYIRR